MKTSKKFDDYLQNLFDVEIYNTPNQNFVQNVTRAYYCNIDLKSEFRFDIIQYGRIKCFLKIMKEYLRIEPFDLECIEVEKLLTAYLKSNL